MLNYVAKRFFHAIFVAFGVSLLCFIFMHLSGDPTSLLLPPDATEEDRVEFRRRMGFEDPLPLQYMRFARNAIKGNFGDSYYFNQPVLKLILERLPATIELNIMAMLIALGVAIPLGIISAVKRGSVIDRGGIVAANTGMSIPNYWLGMMLIMIFAVKLKLLPTSGRGGIEYLILPSISLGAIMWGLFARLTRSLMIEVLNQDYVRTARAKGLGENAVIFRHALKNALIPLVTVIGIQAGQLISSTVVVEVVFAWPGIGRLIVQSIFVRDYPTVQACVLILALIFIILNLMVDILYVRLDPRIRLK